MARSWAQHGKSGEPERAFLAAYRHMFEWIPEHEGSYTLYRMEDTPRLAGLNDHPGAPSRSPAIDEFQRLVKEHVIGPHRDFFHQFYETL